MAARSFLVLAFVTVLLGAPSPASGASNALVAGSPAPSSGTTETTFVFSATYDGRFPVTAMTAQVAGRALSMDRVAGTLASGTWSAATTLPPGTWSATVIATAIQGNSPSVQTAPVVVTPPSTPAPAPATPVSAPAGPGGPGPSPQRSAEEPGSGGGTVPAVEAAGSSPTPSPIVDAAAATPAGPSTDGGTTEPDDPNGAPGEVATDEGEGEGEGEAPSGVEPMASGAVQPHGAPRPTRTLPPATGLPGSPSTDAERAPATDGRQPFGDDALASTVLIGGLVAVASVALIGTMLLLLGRQRRPAERPATPHGPNGPAPSPAEDAVAATLRARTLRRARERLDEDPILAALGIEEAASARRSRVRGSRVGPGTGKEPPRG